MSNYKHKMSYTKTYKRWIAMKQRCYNPNHNAYNNYGGRGIKICERWLNSFSNFFADMGERPNGMTLDRINNDGDYTPRNCRYATPKEQIKNQRDIKKDATLKWTRNLSTVKK